MDLNGSQCEYFSIVFLILIFYLAFRQFTSGRDFLHYWALPIICTITSHPLVINLGFHLFLDPFARAISINSVYYFIFCPSTIIWELWKAPVFLNFFWTLQKFNLNIAQALQNFGRSNDWFQLQNKSLFAARKFSIFGFKWIVRKGNVLLIRFALQEGHSLEPLTRWSWIGSRATRQMRRMATNKTNPWKWTTALNRWILTKQTSMESQSRQIQVQSEIQVPSKIQLNC